MATRAFDMQNSPLTADQTTQLDQLAQQFDVQQLSWVSGYFAGLSAATLDQPHATPAGAAEPETLTVVFGSETGNAERVARELVAGAMARGVSARVVDMADYKLRELRDERFLLIVTATHGEGAPPDPALDFYEFLHGRKAPKLDKLNFAVLALGDSSYEYFCKTGQDFDARLEALGASRLVTRLDCDVDFEQPAAHWVAGALDVFAHKFAEPGSHRSARVLELVKDRQVAPATPVIDRQHPFAAEVLESLVLNGRGSDRETRHIELSLEGSGLHYDPGDVLCLLPRNHPDLVTELLETLALDPAETVSVDDADCSLQAALTREFEITTLTPGFIAAWARHSGAIPLRDLLADDARPRLMQYMRGRWVIDVLQEFPADRVSATALLGMLRRLQPREYSIASSLNAHPDEVHLTVSAVRYESQGRDRYGVASSYLSDRIEPGDTIDIYLRQNRHFRLPLNGDTPVIMIGPGTGVAPYRAFIQERELNGAGGASWLFFGNPHLRTDFLYQTEWQQWLADGVLDRLDVAFSRDQAEKIYVQHRLQEQGADVFSWLENGAHIYVCGDAEYMAPDVHETLIGIVRDHGGLSADGASDYLRNLQRAKRYQRDIY